MGLYLDTYSGDLWLRAGTDEDSRVVLLGHVEDAATRRRVPEGLEGEHAERLAEWRECLEESREYRDQVAWDYASGRI